jgi:hypothetical protein
MQRQAVLHVMAVVLGCAALFPACSGSGGSSDAQANELPGDSAVMDAAGDLAQPDVQEVPDVLDALEDTLPVDVVEASDAGGQDVFPPNKLPFEFTRKPKGDPIPAEETLAFTRKVTGMWKKVDYFRWLLRTSSGVDASSGMADYLAWHNDVTAVKSGDTVTFRQDGLEHNMWIPGSKILSQALNGCVLTGDWTICKVAEQYCKGLTAVVKGFIWDEDDPAPFLMARSVFPPDQSFTMDEGTWQDDGRKKAVQFSTAYKVEDGWNAHSFAWPHNPTWGSMWVTNMRSKDDVCAIVRTTTFLPYAQLAPYEWVQDACKETMDNMVGFNKDIVEYGYYIRTKGTDGKAYVFTDQDLGSYVWYVTFDPLNECTNRLATDLIAYQAPQVNEFVNDCGKGYPSLYEQVAVQGHYYNYPIVWNYHMAALGNALVYGYADLAKGLLEGMADRMDDYLATNTKEVGAKEAQWERDMAVLLVQAASMGLPLTSKEARIVQKHWNAAADELTAWPRWDLWDPAVPDGEYNGGSGFRPPDTDTGVPIEAVAMLIEYCNSPFKNPAGETFVDCSIVGDLSKWGEEEQGGAL